jgi:septation ring formation regulator EzrA
MSEENVTLDFLAHQIRGLRDDVLSLKDDMAVLTAMVVRHDQEFSRLNAKLDDMFNQMRAMVRQHQRFSERLRALEEERP